MNKREARIQALDIARMSVLEAKSADWWVAEDEDKVIEQLEVVAIQLSNQLGRLGYPVSKIPSQSDL